jgi:hypothetical protein
MLIKVVLLFLIAMLVLGMFGKLRAPKLPKFGKRKRMEQARKCPDCGSYIIGDGPCPCHDKKP